MTKSLQGPLFADTNEPEKGILPHNETAATDSASQIGVPSASDERSNKPAVLPFSRAKAIALVITLTGAAFVNTLSAQSVVIILPTIGKTLDIPDSRLQWIVSAYNLAFGCFLLLWGRIADIFGKRFIFVAGSVWVTIATAVNPLMPNEIGFDLFRALHGLGAAANVPTAIGILGVTFPPGKAKNYAFAAYGAGAPLGSVFGSIISGLIAEYTTWRWVFGFTAIMAAAISLAGFILIPRTPASSTTERSVGAKLKLVDWAGAALITSGLIALLFALTEGSAVGWRKPWIPVLIVGSVLIITVFVFWQRHLERQLTGGRPPLMKVSIFHNLQISAVMAIGCLFFASFNNYLFYATYYYQDYMGYSPLQTMVRFLPTGVGGLLVCFAVAFLLSRVPTAFLLICGNLSVSIACLLFAVPIPTTTSYFAWGFWAMLLSVVGADITWPCLTLFTSQALPAEDQAIGGALINAVGQIGRAIGLAIATVVQTAVMAHEHGVPIKEVGPIKVKDAASLASIHSTNWLNFGLGIASLLVVGVAFRKMEVIGRASPPPARSSGEDGIMNAENIETGENALQKMG